MNFGGACVMRESGVVRVLVIDDEPAFQRAMERLVGKTAEVTAVGNAADALALLRSGIWYDVIVSDMRMPDLGGFELFGEIERGWPQQASRMLFITGGGYPHEESALRARGRQVLRKPSSVAIIRAAIEDVVRQPVEGDTKTTQEMRSPSPSEDSSQLISETRSIADRERIAADPFSSSLEEPLDGTYRIVGVPLRRKAR